MVESSFIGTMSVHNQTEEVPLATTSTHDSMENSESSERMRTFHDFHLQEKAEEDGEHYGHNDEDDDLGTVGTSMDLTADGYCAVHPHIQLRRKDPVTGQSYLIKESCDECQREFQQRKLALQKRQARLDLKLQILDENEQHPHIGTKDTGDNGSGRGNRTVAEGANPPTAPPFVHHPYPYEYYHPTPPHSSVPGREPSNDRAPAYVPPLPSHLPHSSYPPHLQSHFFPQQTLYQPLQEPRSYHQHPTYASSLPSTGLASATSTTTTDKASYAAASGKPSTSSPEGEFMATTQPMIQTWIEDAIDKRFTLLEQRLQATMMTQWQSIQKQQEEKLFHLLRLELRDMVSSTESTLHAYMTTTTKAVESLLEQQQHHQQQLQRVLLDQQYQDRQHLLRFMLQQQLQQQQGPPPPPCERIQESSCPGPSTGNPVQHAEGAENPWPFREEEDGMDNGPSKNKDPIQRATVEYPRISGLTTDYDIYQGNYWTDSIPKVVDIGTEAATKTNPQSTNSRDAATKPVASPLAKRLAARTKLLTSPPGPTVPSPNSNKGNKRLPWRGAPMPLTVTTTATPAVAPNASTWGDIAFLAPSTTNDETDKTSLLGDQDKDEVEIDTDWKSFDIIWNSRDDGAIDEENLGTGRDPSTGTTTTASSASTTSFAKIDDPQQVTNSGKDDTDSQYHPGDSFSITKHPDHQSDHEHQPRGLCACDDKNSKHDDGFESFTYLDLVEEEEEDTDDQTVSGPSVASSTCDEERVMVVDYALSDPYGDQGIYTGTILNTTGMPHGSGKITYDDNGRTYDGDWRHGRWHGHGKACFSNGDFYEGGFKFDKRHGRGVYRWKDGRVFDGEYNENKRVPKKSA